MNPKNTKKITDSWECGHGHNLRFWWRWHQPFRSCLSNTRDTYIAFSIIIFLLRFLIVLITTSHAIQLVFSDDILRKSWWPMCTVVDNEYMWSWPARWNIHVCSACVSVSMTVTYMYNSVHTHCFQRWLWSVLRGARQLGGSRPRDPGGVRLPHDRGWLRGLHRHPRKVWGHSRSHCAHQGKKLLSRTWYLFI